MGFAVDCFLQDHVPSVDVCAYIAEFCPVYVQVHGRFWWSIEDCVEVYVSAQAMRQEKAGDDAFVDYV